MRTSPPYLRNSETPVIRQLRLKARGWDKVRRIVIGCLIVAGVSLKPNQLTAAQEPHFKSSLKAAEVLENTLEADFKAAETKKSKTQTSKSHALRYRKIYVPANRTSIWPRGGERYLPIEKTELERLLKKYAKQQISQPEIEQKAHRGRLYGRFSDGELQGFAKYEYQDQAAAGSRFVPWPARSLQLKSSVWQSESRNSLRADPDAYLKKSVGAWGQKNGEIRNGFFAPAAGTLHLAWSLSKDPLRTGISYYEADLIPATRTFMILDLPAQSDLNFTEGLILSKERIKRPTKKITGEFLEEAFKATEKYQQTTKPLESTLPEQEEHSRSVESFSSQDSQDSEWYRWYLMLAPGDLLRVKVLPLENKKEQKLLATKRANRFFQHVRSFEIADRGLELVTEIKYFSKTKNRAKEKKYYQYLLEGGLLPLEVLAGESVLKWRVIPPDLQGRQKLIVHIPEDFDPNVTAVRIRCWTGFVLGKKRVLPRVTPLDARWAEGLIKLNIKKPLEVQQIQLIHSQQTTNEEGSLEIRELSELAQVWVLVSQAGLQVTNTQGTTIFVKEQGRQQGRQQGFKLYGEMRTEIQGERGTTFDFSAQLTPGWKIDSVTTTPRERLAEWYLVQEGSETILKCKLVEGFTSDQKLSLLVKASRNHFNPSAQEPLQSLRILAWKNAEVKRELLQLRPSDSGVLIFPTDVLTLKKEDQQEADSQVIKNLTGGLLYDLLNPSSSRKSRWVRTKQEKINYRTSLEYQVLCLNSSTQSELVIQYEPLSGRLHEVDLYTPTALGTNLKWRLRELGQKSLIEGLTATKLSALEIKTKEYPESGEVWRVQLPRGYENKFELFMNQTHQTVREKGVVIIPLVSPLGGVKHQARLTILKSVSFGPLLIEKKNVTPTSYSSVSIRQQRRVGAFEYASEKLVDSGLVESGEVPQIKLKRGPGNLLTAPIVSQLQLESVHQQDGRVRYTARYSLRNFEGKDLVAQLPKQATLLAVRLNNNATQGTSYRQKNEEIVVRIPGDAKDPVLTIQYQIHGTPLERSSEVEAKLPTLRCEVLPGQWTCLLPLSTEAKIEWKNSWPDWRGRLFGPLAKIKKARVKTSTKNLVEINKTSAGNILSEDGWHVELRNLGVNTPSVIRITSPRKEQEIYWLVMLLFTFLGYQKSEKNIRKLIKLWGWSGVLACVVPELMIAWTAGVFSGLGLAFGIRVVRSFRVTDWALGYLRDQPIRSYGSAGMLFFSFVLLGENVCLAQENKTNNKPSKIYSLLIPVDKNGREASGKQFISEQFYQELTKKKATGLRAWVFGQGEYKVQLMSECGVKNRCQISYTVRTWKENTEIVLPFVESEGVWDRQAKLDGVEIPIHWDGDGSGCRIRVRQPGFYRLVFEVSLATHQNENNSSVRLSVVPVPAGRIKITMPEKVGKLKVAQSVQNKQTNEAGVYEGALKSVSVLKIDWENKESKNNSQLDDSVRQYEWLTFSEDKIVWKAKLFFSEREHWKKKIVVDIDRRFYLISPPAGYLILRQLESQNQEMLRYEILFDEAVNKTLLTTSKGMLLLQMESLEAPVASRYRVPRLVFKGFNPQQKGLAISHENSWEVTLPPEHLRQVISGPRFLEDWDATAGDVGAPRYVLMRDSKNRQAYVEIRPNRKEVKIKQKLQLDCARGKIYASYEATVLNGSLAYQQIITLPDDFKILSVSTGEKNKKLRWKRFKENQLVLFFPAVKSGTHLLEIRGKITRTLTEKPQASDLPLIYIGDNKQRTLELYLYRQEEAAVFLTDENKKAISEISSPGTLQSPWGGKQINFFSESILQLEKQQLTIKENQLKLDMQSMLWATRTQGKWTGTFIGYVRVAEGMLDTLEMRYPKQWENIELVSPGSQKLTLVKQKNALQNNSYLRIKIPKTLYPGDVFRFELQGDIVSGENQKIKIPYVEVMKTSRSNHRRYVRMPRKDKLNWYNWRGVRGRGREIGEQQPALTELLPQNPKLRLRIQEDEGVIYSVRSRRSIESTPRPYRKTQISLLEIGTTISQTGERDLTTRLVLLPTKSTQLVVVIPEEYRLREVMVNNHPAMTIKNKEQRWEIAVDSHLYPQLITLKCQQKASSKEKKFGLVQLEIPVFYSENKKLTPANQFLVVQQDRENYYVAKKYRTSFTETGYRLFQNELIRQIFILSEDLPSGQSMKEEVIWSRFWKKVLRAELDKIKIAISREPKGLVRETEEMLLKKQEAAIEAWREDEDPLTERLESGSRQGTDESWSRNFKRDQEKQFQQNNKYYRIESTVQKIVLVEPEEQSIWLHHLSVGIFIAGLANFLLVLSQRVDQKVPAKICWPAVGLLIGGTLMLFTEPLILGVLVCLVCLIEIGFQLSLAKRQSS